MRTKAQKLLKSLLVIVLVSMLIISSVPVTFAAERYVVGIEVEDVEIMQYTNGHYSYDYYNDIDTIYYNYWYLPDEFTIIYNDGTTEICEDGFDLLYNSDNQCSESEWGVGTHTATIYYYDDNDDEFTCEMNVTITECPIESFEVSDVTIVENTNGYMDEDYVYDEETDEEYYLEYYRYNLEPTVKVHTKDGRTFTSYDNEVYIDDTAFDVKITSGQDYDNQYTTGNDYDAFATVAGMTQKFNVSITESPITKIVVEDLELTPGTSGYFTSNGIWDDEIEDYVYSYYYRYNPMPEITVYTNDNQAYKAYSSYYSDSLYVDIDDTTYKIDVDTNQSSDNSWEPLNTYKASVSINDLTEEFNVTIKESPVESATLTTADVIVNSGGDYYDGFYEYNSFKYDMQGKAKFKNGEETDFTYYSLYYNNEECDILVVDDQSYENQWTIGTHKVTVKFLGFETEMDVNIIESPVKSIEASDLTLYKDIDGYNDWDWYWDEETGEDHEMTYFRYNINPEYTITMKDGSVYKTDQKYFAIDGIYHEIKILDKDGDTYYQSYNNQLQLGNNQLTVSFLGAESDFNIEVLESPVKSIEIDSVKPLVESEYNDYDEYLYNFNLTFNVYYKDGTSEKLAYFNGELHPEFEHENLQSISIDFDLDKWHVGKGNKFTLSYGGATTQGSVELISNSPWEYIEQNGEIVLTKYNGDDPFVMTPDTIDNKKVVGVSADAFPAYMYNLRLSDNIRFITGTLSYQQLSSIYFGASFENINDEMFRYLPDLKEIYVSENNKNYTSLNGVVYNKKVDTIVAIPDSYMFTIVLPVTVKNMDILQSQSHQDISVAIPENSEHFTVVDGVTYTRDMKTVISCDNKSGEYIMPDSVEKIEPQAFTNSKVTDVKVSKNVTEIAYQAFMYCKTLNSVQLPENLKSIETFAFMGCEKLTDADLPQKLESISDLAFYRCAMDTVNIPDSVTSINSDAFSENMNLKTLTVGNSLTALPVDCFDQCKSLTSVTLGKKVEYVGNSCFSGCKALTDLKINSAGIKLGESAFFSAPLTNFNDWKKIKGDIKYNTFRYGDFESIDITKNVTSIAYASFSGCSNLAEINIAPEILKINYASFDGTKWSESQKDGVMYLEHFLYNYRGTMPKDTTVNVKDTTLSLADYALYNQTNLTSIKLNDGLKRIGDRSLSGTSISSINIPASVEQIGNLAFAGCTKLENITIDASNKYYKSVDGVLYNKDMTELIYCPKRADDTFELPQSVTKVSPFAFESANIKTLIVKNSDVEFAPLSVGFKCICEFSELTNPIVNREPIKYNDIQIVAPKNSTALKFAQEYLLSNRILNSGEILGDIDSDETVSIMDATAIQLHLAAFMVLGDDQLAVGDTDKDKAISVMDATQIQLALAGMAPPIK